MENCVTIEFKRGALARIIDSSPKIALYTKAAQHGRELDRYTQDGEVRGQGYTPGGKVLEGGAVVEKDGMCTLVFRSPTWDNATITARGAVIYLAGDGNRAVRVVDLGRDVASTNGPFTLKFPSVEDGGVISL